VAPFEVLSPSMGYDTSEDGIGREDEALYLQSILMNQDPSVER